MKPQCLVPAVMKKYVKRIVRGIGYEITPIPVTGAMPADLDERFVDIVSRLKPGVGTFEIKQFTTYKAVEYIVAAGIKGDLIECGVYRGRQVLMMAETLMALGVRDRELYLYDTFTGITKPTGEDYVGVRTPENVQATMAKWERGLQPDGSNLRKFVTTEEVQANVYSSGYPQARFHFIKGNVLQTLPNPDHEQIALLRLDTDWYESTKHELECLYERVALGGVIIIDDYGRWRGCRKAVDEFFATLGPRAPLLMRTGGSERACIKARS